ncbi:MAG: c-type cytochrome [Hyphomicrobium sp.]|jgi:cytochrome c
MLKWVVAAGLALAMPTVALAQDKEAGKKVFTKCAPCHAIGPGAKNKVGPELNGILGRAAASVEGFNYSPALKASGITWDDAALHEWVADPKKKVPGNKMLFAGVKDETERDDLIAYIESFNADGSSK